MIFDPVPPMRRDKAVVIATDDAIIVYHPFIHSSGLDKLQKMRKAYSLGVTQ
jgi:hypothetical protein